MYRERKSRTPAKTVTHFLKAVDEYGNTPAQRAAPRCCRCPFYVICYSVYCRMTKNTRPPMELNLHGERAFCVLVRFEGIYSACGSRLTHGLAPQQADAEPVHCFIATDSWSCRYPLWILYIFGEVLQGKGDLHAITHLIHPACTGWKDSVLFFPQLRLWYHLKDQPRSPGEKRRAGLIL